LNMAQFRTSLAVPRRLSLTTACLGALDTAGPAARTIVSTPAPAPTGRMKLIGPSLREPPLWARMEKGMASAVVPSAVAPRARSSWRRLKLVFELVIDVSFVL